MTIFIARDGDMLGEYPHSQLEAMARAGRLQPEDDYWHEGMEEWALLRDFLRPQAWEADGASTHEAPGPELAAPRSGLAIDRRVLLGAAAALLGVILLVGFVVIKPDANEDRVVTVKRALQPNAPTALEMRDKAAADLRARIERLPASAEPPLNTFYYDVRVNMNRTVSPEAPWTAAIHGWENVIDPATSQTVSRTEFVLSTDYEDGEWAFKKYEATVADLSSGTSKQIIDDESAPMPPSLVGALGLKRRGTPTPQPTVAKVPGFN